MVKETDIGQPKGQDALTGLLNRESFFKEAEKLDAACSECRMDAVVVDIHRFQMINERHGKHAADRVLLGLAKCIAEVVDEEKGIACRREADTFLIYWRHRDDYADLIERFAIGIRSSDGTKTIRLRVGVYQNVDKSLDIERRFDRAQSAADQVRDNLIRPIGYYDQQLHEKEMYAAQLIEDFPKAIEEHQFVVHFHPKFDIRPDRPVLASAETLTRWIHPKFGVINPTVFISLFEENGLIGVLDRYVWRETCKHLHDWRTRLGVTIPVSVNVSRIDLYEDTFIDYLLSLLKEFDLKPDDLYLEITESAYSMDSEQIVRIVRQLRTLGFFIEMDDFGTGYSSLNMIASLPIDAIKIDMAFVRNAFRDGRDTRLIEVILEIADYLRVPVIVEGVETREQLLALKAMGCQYVQGFYFARPYPADEFEHILLEKKVLTGERLHWDPKEKVAAVSAALKDAMPFPEDQMQPYMQWMMEQVPGGFFVFRLDEKREILYVNKQMLHLYGCTTQEEFSAMTKNRFQNMVYPDDLEAAREQALNLMYDPDADNQGYIEYRILRRDGRIIWLGNYGHMIHMPDGSNVVLVFSTDITMSRRAYMQERRQINRRRRLMEKAADNAATSFSVLCADLDTGVVSQTGGYDRLEADYIGASLEECLRAHGDLIVSDEDREAFERMFMPLRLIERYETGEDPADLVCICRRPDGSMCRERFHGHVLFDPSTDDHVLFFYEKEVKN